MVNLKIIKVQNKEQIEAFRREIEAFRREREAFKRERKAFRRERKAFRRGNLIKEEALKKEEQEIKKEEALKREVVLSLKEVIKVHRLDRRKDDYFFIKTYFLFVEFKRIFFLLLFLNKCKIISVKKFI